MKEKALGKVLVTGATGFIGSHLAERLAREDRQVRCLVRKSSNRRWLEGLEIETVVGDVTSPETLRGAVEGADVVFHLAARGRALNEESLYRTNATGTVNLMKAIAEFNPTLRRIVVVSSLAVTGPSRDGKPVTESTVPLPITAYGASKLAGEDSAMAFHPRLPVTIVRPPVVYGPRDVNLCPLFRYVKRGIKPVLGWRKRYGSMIYIDDLIDALFLVAQNERAPGNIYFVVSEPWSSLSQFYDTIADVMGRRAVTVHVPVLPCTLFVFGFEMISRARGKVPLLHVEKLRDLRQRTWVCEGKRAEQELGFTPSVTLREGVENCVRWYENESWI